MKTISEVTLEVAQHQTITIPRKAQALNVKYEADVVTVCLLVYADEPTTSCEFCMYVIGDEMTHTSQYIGMFERDGVSYYVFMASCI